MKKLVAVALLFLLFIGAKQSTVSSGASKPKHINDDIMHVDSLNKSVLELEKSVDKLNKLIK